MDAQRFDDLARLISSGATRRRVLTAFAGAAFSFLSARSGQAQCVNPDTCQADDECCDGFSCDPVSSSCLDDIPEPCGFPGSSCEVDADCCDGPCTDNVCPCRELGSACTDGLQCCQPDCENCIVDCLGGICGICREDGESCTDDVECCFGDCIEGTCTFCGDLGSDCSTSDECCGGICVDGTCSPCRRDGEACTTDADCCDSGFGYGCSDGICQDRCTDQGCDCCPGNYCIFEAGGCGRWECDTDFDCPIRAVGCHNGVCVDYEWWVCEITSDCDPGLECRDGLCVLPCAPDGDACDEFRACCGKLPCVEGICAAAECTGSGDPCMASAECCGDLVCAGDICQAADDTGEPPGDDEPDDDEVTQLPDTGVGAAGSGRNSFPGLASLAAGAAALLAGKTLRKEPDEISKTGDEAL